MVIQKSHLEDEVYITDQNGADTNVDVTFMDEDGTKFILQAKAKKLDINSRRTCECGPSHINCLTAKEWIKCQLGI